MTLREFYDDIAKDMCDYLEEYTVQDGERGQYIIYPFPTLDGLIEEMVERKPGPDITVDDETLMDGGPALLYMCIRKVADTWFSVYNIRSVFIDENELDSDESHW